MTGPEVVSEVPTEPLRTSDGRLWFLPGDQAWLTFVRESGEVEDILAMWIKPKGPGAGWVCTDGTRLPPRPRPVIRIAIVWPEEHRAVEDVVHRDEDDDTPEVDDVSSVG